MLSRFTNVGIGQWLTFQRGDYWRMATGVCNLGAGTG